MPNKSDLICAVLGTSSGYIQAGDTTWSDFDANNTHSNQKLIEETSGTYCAKDTLSKLVTVGDQSYPMPDWFQTLTV